MSRFLGIVLWLTIALALSGCVGVSQTRVPPTSAPSPTENVPTTLPSPVPTENAPTAQPSPVPTESAPTAQPSPTQNVPTATPPSVPTRGGTNVQDATLEKLIELARADLMTRAQVPADAITVKSTQSVEWSDASLGCPKLGVFYIQVITPGYLIVLQANGQTYEYHTTMDRVELCERQ
jgi:hypothetical protein